MSFFKISTFCLSLFLLATTSCKKSLIKNCDAACDLHGYCDLTTGTCNCESGYEGVNCETETRSRFTGAYSVVQDSNGVIKNYNCIIANGTGSAYTISISALNNASFDATVAANNTISISDFDAQFIQITGAGTMTGNQIDLNITFKPNFDPAYTLKFKLTKQ